MNRAKTRFVVVIDGKPGAFGLWVPDMPGCTSMGETVDDALKNAQEALRMWAEDAMGTENLCLHLGALRKSPEIPKFPKS